MFAEILYLKQKGRIETSLDDVADYFQRYPNCREYPLNYSVVKHADTIVDIPELHDRLIAVTASALKIPLLTNDPEIAGSQSVETIWN